MKKLIPVALMIFAFSCSEKKDPSLIVEGTIKNVSDNKVYLQIIAPESQPIIVDSSSIGTDGKFSLKTTSNEESFFVLQVGSDFIPLISDAKKIRVDADFQK